jgi:hypothetical protein
MMTLVSGAYMLVLLHWRVFLDVGIVTLISGPYMLGLFHCWVFLDVGIATLVSYILVLLYWWVFPICWHCFTGELSLYVGIVTFMSGPYMLELFHCWVFLDVGIATQRSYILVFLYWWVFPICWHCYTDEWSYMLVLLHWWVVLYVGIAILVSGPYILALLYWWVITGWHWYTGEWSIHVGIAILVGDPYMLALLF